MSCFMAMERWFILIYLVSFGHISNGMNAPVSDARQMRDIIGVTHVAGKYHLTDKDFLNEGADQILSLGSRVIKIWFYGKRHEHPEHVYSFNSNWRPIKTLVEGAQLPYFEALFNKPFTTYILNVTSLGRPDDYWRGGINHTQALDEQTQFYELTRHLLTTYSGTGKNFILQHWEGDWMVRGHTELSLDPTPSALNNMIIWLNARQAGVTRARREVPHHSVYVFHAAEVNRVVSSMLNGQPNMVNKVLPYADLDLISYSAWDAAVEGYETTDLFVRTLDYIAANARPSEHFGAQNVYLGEFGWPENLFDTEHMNRAIQQAVETSLKWGCPYIVYWQLYCNHHEDKTIPIPVTSNDAVAGFWLIRPDGSKAWGWDYFYNLLKITDDPR